MCCLKWLIVIGFVLDPIQPDPELKHKVNTEAAFQGKGGRRRRDKKR